MRVRTVAGTLRVRSKDMAVLLQRIDGKDYMPFFDKYYWGTEMPEMPKG